ncbi:hypothetical protein QRX60_23505 [Amycolatopsis mongoliensis]|uniref:Protein-tyrosine-phosphatase-like N-terminal domain-containing protein n=1 Tax=Amycolatopsis mongoliensis TaxID=715475 RepID=A0A9Y2JZS7_9PSEU|nr:hypothetical protein [Amycolatopsis sp. 4-36]WIY06669.1 hypothetical protein QRX60_23505 [Amycolatopsis sp. 4-36]
MSTHPSPRERLEIRSVIQRLTVKFATAHSAGHIQDVVDESYRTFDDARIRDFVPLLTERRARRELAKANS